MKIDFDFKENEYSRLTYGSVYKRPKGKTLYMYISHTGVDMQAYRPIGARNIRFL